MRWLRRIGIGLGLLVAAALACGLWLSHTWRTTGLPLRAGSSRLAGLEAAVTVRFDAFGVPHVQAASVNDAAAALGWLHANDRMTQLELGRRALRGTLAEVAGAGALPLDQLAYELRLLETAQTAWEDSGPESRARLEAYARGVNAWLSARGDDLPPGLRVLLFGQQVEPWSPVDSLGFALLMSRDLCLMIEPEIERLETLTALGEHGLRARFAAGQAWPIPAQTRALAEQRRPSTPEQAPGETPEELPGEPSGQAEQDGSNAWAIDGTRTAHGEALVANDAHLSLQLPSVWYQAQVRAPGWEVAGLMLIGLPEVIVGTGPHVSWGVTNSGLDQSDLLYEQLSPRHPDQVRRGDGWAPIELEERSVAVRSAQDRIQVRRRTDLGPLLARDGHTASLAWAAYERFDGLQAFHELARARDLDGVRTAISGFIAPAQNLLVATDTGQILHTIAGQVPVRSAHAGWLPLPAREGSDWTGYRSGADLLWRSAPASGVLTSANDDFLEPGERAQHGGEFDVPYRAARARSVLLEHRDWTAATLGELQGDTRSEYALEVVAGIAALLCPTGTPADGDPEARVLRLLLAWDGRMDVDSRAARVYTELERALRWSPLGSGGFGYHRRARVLAALRGDLDASSWGASELQVSPQELRRQLLRELLARAWAASVDREGSLQPYGLEHELTLWHPLSRLPFIGQQFTRGPWPVGGSATTLSAMAGNPVLHGPSMRWIGAPASPDESLVCLPGGQSGHPFDAHYDDQIEDFLAGRLHAVRWSPAAIESATLTTLELTP